MCCGISLFSQIYILRSASQCCLIYPTNRLHTAVTFTKIVPLKFFGRYSSLIVSVIAMPRSCIWQTAHPIPSESRPGYGRTDRCALQFPAPSSASDTQMHHSYDIASSQPSRRYIPIMEVKSPIISDILICWGQTCSQLRYGQPLRTMAGAVMASRTGKSSLLRLLIRIFYHCIKFFFA